jgi:uncharacterized membrane protein
MPESTPPFGSETPPGSPQAPDSRDDALRKVALFDYLLHIAGLLFSMGLLSVVALIINYIKRDDARGTIYESHMTWMIATFWWTLFWVVVSFVPAVVLTFFSLGLLSFLFVVPALWYLYRMLKGLLRLIDSREIP